MSFDSLTGSPAKKPSIVDYGIDALTVTCSDPVNRSRLTDKVAGYLCEQRDLGNQMKPWTMLGYEGFKCGSVAMGELNGTTLVKLGADAAWRHWLACFELGTSVSRIDTQITVSNVQNPQATIQHHYRQATEFVKRFKRRPEVHLWHSNNGTDTLYLNKRCGDRFGRVYDKGAESKLDHYAHCVRYEVEWKGKAAKHVAHAIATDDRPLHKAAAYCQGFLKSRGVHSRALYVLPLQMIVPRRRSDVQRHLRWLTKSVRPCAQQVAAVLGRDAVLEAIGLLDHTDHGPAVIDQVVHVEEVF